MTAIIIHFYSFSYYIIFFILIVVLTLNIQLIRAYPRKLQIMVLKVAVTGKVFVYWFDLSEMLTYSIF